MVVVVVYYRASSVLVFIDCWQIIKERKIKKGKRMKPFSSPIFAC
jgi:hypothetical protein